MEAKYLSIAQVQERFGGVSPRTIFNWRKTIGFPEPVGPGKKLYSIAAIEKFEEEHFQPEQEVVNG